MKKKESIEILHTLYNNNSGYGMSERLLLFRLSGILYYASLRIPLSKRGSLLPDLHDFNDCNNCNLGSFFHCRSSKKAIGYSLGKKAVDCKILGIENYNQVH